MNKNYKCPACGKQGEFDEEDKSWHCVNEPWLEIPDAPEITSRYETYIERNTNTQERST